MDHFDHDIWLYQGLEGRIFRAGEAIPPKSEGWLDRQALGEAVAPVQADVQPAADKPRNKGGRPRKVQP